MAVDPCRALLLQCDSTSMLGIGWTMVNIMITWAILSTYVTSDIWINVHIRYVHVMSFPGNPHYPNSLSCVCGSLCKCAVNDIGCHNPSTKNFWKRAMPSPPMIPTTKKIPEIKYINVTLIGASNRLLLLHL